MTTIEFGGGPSIDQRRAFSQLRDGAHVPGYRGYCPQLKYKNGKTYGTDTHELSNEYRKSRSVTMFDSPPTKPLKNIIPESTGDNKYTENMVPGYTGYIPRWPFKFGGTYKEDSEICIDEFLTNTANHEKKYQDLKRQTSNYPKLKAVYTDPHVRDKLNLYRDTHPSKPLLLEEKRESTEAPIPGYQGFIPRVHTTELGLGRRYHETTGRGLESFYRETQRHHDIVNGKIPTQPIDGHKSVNFVKTAGPNTRRLYQEDGMIPKYTGYLPHRRFAFGNTYGDTTRALSVCSHDKPCYGDYMQTKSLTTY